MDVLINYTFFDFLFRSKKLFKTNVKMCWKKLRHIWKLFIVTFLIMVLLSHLSNSFFFSFFLRVDENVVFFFNLNASDAKLNFGVFLLLRLIIYRVFLLAIFLIMFSW